MTREIRWRCGHRYDNGVICGAGSTTWAGAERHAGTHSQFGARGARIDCVYEPDVAKRCHTRVGQKWCVRPLGHTGVCQA